MWRRSRSRHLRTDQDTKEQAVHYGNKGRNTVRLSFKRLGKFIKPGKKSFKLLYNYSDYIAGRVNLWVNRMSQLLVMMIVDINLSDNINRDLNEINQVILSRKHLFEWIFFDYQLGDLNLKTSTLLQYSVFRIFNRNINLQEQD